MNTEQTRTTLAEMRTTLQDLVMTYYSLAWPMTAEGDQHRQQMSECLQRLRIAIATIDTEVRTTS